MLQGAQSGSCPVAVVPSYSFVAVLSSVAVLYLDVIAGYAPAECRQPFDQDSDTATLSYSDLMKCRPMQAVLLYEW